MRDLDPLADALGIDPNDPESRRAYANTEADHQLLRTLITHRKAVGLSQQDVADRLGRPVFRIVAFERYDSDPTLSMIRRYAQAIGVRVGHYVTPDTPLVNGEARCICDGAAHYTAEENKARHPFIIDADCPIHGAGAATDLAGEPS